MIISQRGLVVEKHNSQTFAWSNLRRFANTAAVAEQIVQRFNLLKSQQKNAKKQAAQISFALSQAKEYFDAAKGASLATRPVQLYYGCMALALSEILWKGDGRVSIDKLRSSDGRHGLIFSREAEQPLRGVEHLDRLRAKPDLRGTFGVWKRFARNSPLAGQGRFLAQDGTGHEGPTLIARAADVEGPPLPASGVSLLDCAKNLPTLYESLGVFGVKSNLVRATLERLEQKTNAEIEITDTVVIHPNSIESIEAVQSEFLVSPRMVEYVSVTQPHSGLRVQFKFTSNDPGPHFSLPEGTSVSPKQTYLRPKNSILSEFGYIYVALYVSGMFSRYFPDIWMQHLNQNSELALFIEMICEQAVQRLPLLTLTELDGALHMYRD